MAGGSDALESEEEARERQSQILGKLARRLDCVGDYIPPLCKLGHDVDWHREAVPERILGGARPALSRPRPRRVPGIEPVDLSPQRAVTPRQ